VNPTTDDEHGPSQLGGISGHLVDQFLRTVELSVQFGLWPVLLACMRHAAEASTPLQHRTNFARPSDTCR
jgi:hypothetical protein